MGLSYPLDDAGVAQLAEQLFCNSQPGCVRVLSDASAYSQPSKAVRQVMGDYHGLAARMAIGF